MQSQRGWSGPAGRRRRRSCWCATASRRTRVEKRFSGGLASANPGLSDEGRAQIRAVADWLAPLAERVDAVVASPVRRTLESAEILAEALGHPVEVEPGFAEMEFGVWDGLTFAEVAEKYPDELDAWLGSLDVAPEGGESFRAVQERVLDGLARLLEAHAGKTVVVVSHVTPIKTLVAHARGRAARGGVPHGAHARRRSRCSLVVRRPRVDADVQRAAAGQRRVHRVPVVTTAR